MGQKMVVKGGNDRQRKSCISLSHYFCFVCVFLFWVFMQNGSEGKDWLLLFGKKTHAVTLDENKITLTIHMLLVLDIKVKRESSGEEGL